MFLIYFSSLILYSILIYLGVLMMFIDIFSFIFIPVFGLLLILVQQCYREANCKALERKDFIITLIIVVIYWILYYFWNKHFTFDNFSYLYLSTYVAIISFAGSLRFKTLLK